VEKDRSDKLIKEKMNVNFESVGITEVDSQKISDWSFVS
jgi:limonene-1,2-epoxide hydrolase